MGILKKITTAELSLIETIGNYASKLITDQPSLRFFGLDLSTEDLGELTSLLQAESRAGKPVQPPNEFILEVRRVVPQKAWRQLTTLLEKWSHTAAPQSDQRLSVEEHEVLTMDLLWQTLLITECHDRHETIQEEIASIRKGQ